MKLLSEISVPGRTAFSLPENRTGLRPEDLLPPDQIRKDPPDLPEISEPDLIRHYTNLSRRNFGVDTGFYPLGSCTMKYNPKICEVAARKEAFTGVHPLQPEDTVQGLLELLHQTERMLSDICGMARFSLQPAAGAHGEFLGMLLIRAYHRKNGEERHRVLIPDSAHGTNPSSAHVCGFKVETIPSDSEGEIDLNRLSERLDKDVAALMLTNPNTLGLFEKRILEISRMIHKAGALLYYDGANLNPILGITRPGDMGFDVIHINLHKTFATPHGGGGPGAGPVGVCSKLEPFLPVPLIEKGKHGYRLVTDRPESVGRVRAFFGNVGVIIRAYTYIRALGMEGLQRAGVASVLNANYLLSRLKGTYELPYPRRCMHEFVISAQKQLQKHGVRAMDIAKRLIDFRFHPPTCYFPLIVPEALMIEPTETESLETLDAFAETMIRIGREAVENPDLLHKAPQNAPVTRVDEVAAARNLQLTWSPDWDIAK